MLRSLVVQRSLSAVDCSILTIDIADIIKRLVTICRHWRMCDEQWQLQLRGHVSQHTRQSLLHLSDRLHRWWIHLYRYLPLLGRPTIVARSYILPLNLFAIQHLSPSGKYTSGWVLRLTRKIDSDISPTPFLNVMSSKVWNLALIIDRNRIWGAVFQNQASKETYLKSETYIRSEVDWPMFPPN